MATAERQSVSGQIAAITKHNGPDDPRLPALRRRLRYLVAADLHAWSAAVLAELDDGPSYHKLVAEAHRVRRALDAEIPA